MPIVFGVVGILFIVAGARGQSTTLFSLIKDDFSGQPNYFEWMIAIFLVGAIGYIKQLSTISRMFMFIILAGLLYKNKQVFSEFHAEETAIPKPSTGTSSQTDISPASILPDLGGLAPLAALPELDPSLFN